jgi:outer membrane protein assembly factor BamB
MKQIASSFLTLLLASATLGGSLGLNEFDWPQWRGPERTGISRETGLLKTWPADGPRRLWSVSSVGEGYGSLAIRGDRIFVQGARNNESAVFCLNRNDGKTIWTAGLGSKLNQDRGHGPRGTPTVDGDRVYALSESGDLACLKASDGSVLWRRNILRDFGGENPHWLISESPLIDGELLFVTPGGDGAGVVALNKMTGKTIWTSKELNDRAAYSSCVIANIEGVRAIMTLTDKAGVGLRASDGKLMWRYQPVANRTANVATPVFHDNKVFYTTSYGTGSALLGLKAENGTIKATEIYFSREMQNHHGGVVLVGGYLYGFSGSLLTCIEFATGKLMWKDRSVGKGSITYADGNLYLLSENNVVGLAEATPEAYREKGRFRISDQGWPSWAHPVVCGGRLYLRNQGILECFDIRAR